MVLVGLGKPEVSIPIVNAAVREVRLIRGGRDRVMNVVVLCRSTSEGYSDTLTAIPLP